MKLLRNIKLGLVCSFFIPNVFALPLDNSNHTIFSCDTDNGKRILLSSVGDSIEYKLERFGAEKPELFILKNKSTVDVDIKNGEDENVKYVAMDLSNGDYIYRSLFGIHDNDRTVGIGVFVFKDDKLIGKVYCTDFEKIKDGKSKVDLPNDNEKKDSSKIIPAGTYKVGVDIPAGEYKVFAKSKDGTGTVFVSNSPNRHDVANIVHHEIFTGQTYVTVKKGQYLRVSFGEFTLVK